MHFVNSLYFYNVFRPVIGLYQQMYNTHKQETQCTYNVTMRRVQETIVTVEKELVLIIGMCVHAWACMRACGYPSA